MSPPPPPPPPTRLIGVNETPPPGFETIGVEMTGPATGVGVLPPLHGAKVKWCSTVNLLKFRIRGIFTNHYSRNTFYGN